MELRRDYTMPSTFIARIRPAGRVDPGEPGATRFGRFTFSPCVTLILPHIRQIRHSPSFWLVFSMADVF
jgi:hypothetical protein